MTVMRGPPMFSSVVAAGLERGPLLADSVSLLRVRVFAGRSGYRMCGHVSRGKEAHHHGKLEEREHLHYGGHATKVRPWRLGGGRLGAEADGCRAGDARLRPRSCEGEHNGPHRGV